MKAIIITAASLFFFGCVVLPTKKEVRMLDTIECESLGFVEGTPPFGECLLKLRAIRAQIRSGQEVRGWIILEGE